MSLCISVVTPEGIVVAGESRQTQFVAGVNRIGSDSAIKVFSLTDTVLAATTGWGFLQPQGSTVQKNISSLIENFKPTIPAGLAYKRFPHFFGLILILFINNISLSCQLLQFQLDKLLLISLSQDMTQDLK